MLNKGRRTLVRNCLQLGYVHICNIATSPILQFIDRGMPKSHALNVQIDTVVAVSAGLRNELQSLTRCEEYWCNAGASFYVYFRFNRIYTFHYIGSSYNKIHFFLSNHYLTSSN